MNQKKAKLLRRWARYNPNSPREYENVVVARKKYLRFNMDGKSEEIIKDRIQTFVKDENYKKYKTWKKAYYMTKTKGGL